MLDEKAEVSYLQLFVVKNTVENTEQAPEPIIPHKATGLRPPWQPGESGNPNGRPRKRPLSEGYDDLLRQEIPEVMLRQLNTMLVNNRPVTVNVLKKGATWADAIAYGQAKKAAQGDATCAKEMREGVEGKATQRVELISPEDKGFEVKVSFEMPAGRRPLPSAHPKDFIQPVLEAVVVAAVTATDPEE